MQTDQTPLQAEEILPTLFRRRSLLQSIEGEVIIGIRQNINRDYLWGNMGLNLLSNKTNKLLQDTWCKIWFSDSERNALEKRNQSFHW